MNYPVYYKGKLIANAKKDDEGYYITSALWLCTHRTFDAFEDLERAALDSVPPHFQYESHYVGSKRVVDTKSESV